LKVIIIIVKVAFGGGGCGGCGSISIGVSPTHAAGTHDGRCDVRVVVGRRKSRGRKGEVEV